MASRNASARWRFVGAGVAVLGFALAVGSVVFARGEGQSGAAASIVADNGLHAEPYSAAKLEQLRRESRPVFVDATAAWCITCLVNEKVALSSPAVAEAFARTHTAFLIADWTKRDAAITELLAAHGRSGVPLYLYYKPGASDAAVLPQILTADAVLAAVDGK
jgi:thiol:disulfide interchange protein DsbD